MNGPSSALLAPPKPLDISCTNRDSSMCLAAALPSCGGRARSSVSTAWELASITYRREWDEAREYRANTPAGYTSPLVRRESRPRAQRHRRAQGLRRVHRQPGSDSQVPVDAHEPASTHTPEQPVLDVRNQPHTHRPRHTERRLCARLSYAHSHAKRFFSALSAELCPVARR